MKRLVICLDGTWNNAASEKERDDGSRVYKPTNVLKLARGTRTSDDAGVQQITYYDAGVGAMNRAPNLRTKVVRFFDNLLGGGWGAGFEINVESAYTFLANNYAEGDEVFVFGFSRGASQARSLIHLIEWVGGFPAKNDVYYVPRLFTSYLEARGRGSGADAIEAINLKRSRESRPLDPLDPLVVPRLVFLGVWDTVLALGSRILARGGSCAPRYRFHTPSDPPKTVERVRHALAIDERRHDFQPEIWNAGEATEAIEQRWFAGVHSNVGGGLVQDGLANCALGWISREAEAAGLALNSGFLKHYRAYAADRSSHKGLVYEISDTALRPIRGFRGVRDLNAVAGTLDESAFTRLGADPAKHAGLDERYRPANLLAYLARNPDHDGRLDAETLQAVQALR